MAQVREAITLKHRANLGEDVEEVSFAAGEEVTILQEWADHYLCKNDAGQVFNIPKDRVEA